MNAIVTGTTSIGKSTLLKALTVTDVVATQELDSLGSWYGPGEQEGSLNWEEGKTEWLVDTSEVEKIMHEAESAGINLVAVGCSSNIDEILHLNWDFRFLLDAPPETIRQRAHQKKADFPNVEFYQRPEYIEEAVAGQPKIKGLVEWTEVLDARDNPATLAEKIEGYFQPEVTDGDTDGAEGQAAAASA